LSRLKQVISLIGMPGGGKSTIGKLLAKRLALSFVDLDAAIERDAGCTIATIFDHEGEPAFRRREADALRRLVLAAPAVIATGGGAVLSPASRELLRSQTLPIYLFAPPAELWRRVGKNNSRRPLLQVTDPYARLRELFEQRHCLYCEVAAVTVETGRTYVPSAVEEILRQLQPTGARPLDTEAADGAGPVQAAP
jgi:shikimate kinase